MDGDSWAARLSSTSKRYQYALQSHRSSSDMFLGFEDVEMDDDIQIQQQLREEFPCPFCTCYFDIVGLCCHIDDQHHLDSKNGVCPICAVRVGVDMVAHLTLQHGNIFKMQQKRKSRKGSVSTLSLLRRELREGNLQSLFGGSSYLSQPTNATPDPLLSSFILPIGNDLESAQSKSSAESVAVAKSTSEQASERKPQSPPLSIEDKEERSKRSEFVQGMLLSTIFDDGCL
uniref:protein DEHYDRATION-INDUCED 19 homolog 3 n=1 Tax=Erigeron canadensis TaxID=72917 RepID=UPI001CB92ED3|nr:protein DEHYDRATION-INDUCED 19 homolog 3 [Erigeron canadensis]